MEEPYITKLQVIPKKAPDGNLIFKFREPNNESYVGLMYNSYVLTRHSPVIKNMILSGMKEGICGIIDCDYMFDEMFNFLTIIDRKSFQKQEPHKQDKLRSPGGISSNSGTTGPEIRLDKIVDLNLFGIANFYSVDVIMNDIHSTILTSRSCSEEVLMFYVSVLKPDDCKLKSLVGMMSRNGTLFPIVELSDEVLLEISENIPITLRGVPIERNLSQLITHNYIKRGRVPENSYRDATRSLKITSTSIFCEDVKGMGDKILKYVIDALRR